MNPEWSIPTIRPPTIAFTMLRTAPPTRCACHTSIEAERVLRRELEPHLVHQRGRLQGVSAALEQEQTLRELAQVGIEQREQPIEGFAVAFAGLAQDAGDGAGSAL